MFVGGTNRGWGSRGTKPFAVDRINWTGKVPFEIQQMRAEADGFTLKFTMPVDRATAEEISSYKLSTFTYIYQESYGSPEVDHTTAKVVSAKVSSDGLTVRLVVEGLQRGHVHHLVSAGVRGPQNEPLLHQDAYYTLNYLKK